MKELGRSAESIRLFPSGENPVKLDSEKIEQGAQAVSRLVKFAQDKGAQKIVLLGTSAVRDCVNREDFSDRIVALCGMPLTIISGEVEARLAAQGVRVDPVYADYRNILAFDLGGGSLEISKLHGKQCTFARSYPLGSVRLTAQLQARPDGVIDEQHQLSFQAMIRSQLKDALLNEAARDSLLVGAGGAFTAIALYLEAIGEAPISGRLPVLRIRELKDRICKLTFEERKSLKGIPPDRIDIMPAALLTICVLADLTQAEAFHLTHHGVRQGMIQLLIAEDAMHS
jgi:exopolyphosphatase/guanosine-5'-triphosphate,3'-diphosphate pyrophosphatase